jgi:hypothetical protein
MKRKADSAGLEQQAEGGGRDHKILKAMPDEPQIAQPPDAGIIPEVPFRWLITGQSKSGKSNMLRWVHDHYYADYWDRVYLLSPTANIDYMWSSLKGVKDKDRHTEPTVDTFVKILNDHKKGIQGTISDRPPKMSQAALHRKKMKAPKAVIYIDDSIAERFMTSRIFLKAAIQARHYGLSWALLTQSYNHAPRRVRINSSHVSMFPSKLSEIERLYDDVGPKSMNKNEFKEMVLDATEPEPGDEFPFLHVDVFKPASERFRRNLTEVLTLEASHDDEIPVEEKKERGMKAKRKKTDDGEDLADREAAIERDSDLIVRKQPKKQTTTTTKKKKTKI